MWVSSASTVEPREARRYSPAGGRRGRARAPPLPSAAAGPLLSGGRPTALKGGRRRRFGAGSPRRAKPPAAAESGVRPPFGSGAPCTTPGARGGRQFTYGSREAGGAERIRGVGHRGPGSRSRAEVEESAAGACVEGRGQWTPRARGGAETSVSDRLGAARGALARSARLGSARRPRAGTHRGGGGRE